MTKLSLIIPVKNDLDNFKKTITNLNFYEDIETIVVDGNSNDGLKEYIFSSDLKKKITFINQKSKGLYQGFNEGLDSANSDYVAFLCCGDIYRTSVALKIIEKYDADIIAASCTFLEDNKKVTYLRSKRKSIGNRNMSILHGSLIVKKKAYEAINGFDENFKVSADVQAIYEIKKFGKIKYSDEIVVDQIPYGVSNDLYFRKIFEHSRILIRANYFFYGLMYIPMRIIKDYIILTIWKLIKNKR